MESARPDAAVNFIRDLHRDTTGLIAFQTLPGADEQATRVPADVERFVRRAARGEMDAYHCPVALRPGADIASGEAILRSKRNAAEAPCAWTDIDAKDITIPLERAAEILRALRFPPSKIVWSGNGLHPYWFLTEPFDVQAEQERFEAVLRRLVDKFGGDPAPAHVAALMRLPGTHNRKRGACKLVTVEGDGANKVGVRRYHFEDLEEWLDEQPVVIERKPSARGGAAEPESNPFLTAAREYGWKPTLDVEGELGRMAVGNIHHTCVRVSASLLRRGTPPEDVVARLLGEIERAKAAAGEAFQKRREERRLRTMCRSWIAKHPVEHRRAPGGSKEERVMDEPGEVHEYEGARAKRKAKAEADTGDKASLHIVLAEGVLAAMRERGEAVLFTPKTMWRFSDGMWMMMPDGASAFLETRVEEGCIALGIKSTTRIIRESRAWIMRQPALWRETIPWDQHGKIPTRSGLVDPDTLSVEPARPEHYCTWRIEAEFDPSATCPWWLRMLDDTFADRSEETRVDIVRTIQEMAGCSLIDNKPREMSKGLILQGGSNAGKTGLLDVLSGLHDDNPITVGLDAIAGTHGLMPFVRRAPWTLHEAFEASKWHFSASVKAIVTGEPFAVNIKNGPIITTRFRGPLFWGTNYPPQFKEATRAIVNRFVVIECRQTFKEEAERIGAAAEAERRGFARPSDLILAEERPGVLNWAIEGLRRAKAKGRIVLSEEAEDTREILHRDGNLIAGFVADCIDFDPSTMVATADFNAAFSAWWADQKGENRNSPGPELVGKAVAALGDQRIGQHQTEIRDNQGRYYAGVTLNTLGLDYHKRSLESKFFEGKTVRATRDGTINRDIPETWAARASVVAMRKAHAVTSRSAGAGAGATASATPVTASGPVTDPRCHETSVTQPVTRPVTSGQAAEPPSKILF